ncbi:Cuticle protein [Caenorhabditis elegans]|uniref:Cuticle protein n=1 Tax=Caenorhabditis elegans TaxID=6239 RepID=Q19063_CAEEL|nr:Cuticle protein [Caenorhabditis elegans]CCD65904.1 Cuticle protein [Caenorhabditis elegans]|eukprot:NP_495502.1 Uncharacterized protein CELE_E04F6.8 [Caenorhabditis elegans]
MSRFLISSFILIAFVLQFGEGSIAVQEVKDGEKVQIELFKGAKAIQRSVDAGEQIFHFEGENKGVFVDANGKAIDSSNYEENNGHLVIKKFTKADVGSYSEYPTKIIKTKTDHGFSGVAAPVLKLSLQ